MAQTMNSLQTTEYERRRAAEYDSLCDALLDRLLSRTIPPDDAYWWTRIATEEAAHSIPPQTVVPVTTM